jgi:hypothetical protein
MPSELPDRCCGNCRFWVPIDEYVGPYCGWAEKFPSYLIIDMDKWDSLCVTGGTDCPAFSQREEGTETK